MQQFLSFAAGMRYGQGVDLATGKLFANTAVTASGPLSSPFSGCINSIELSATTSKEDIERSLSVSVDANLNYGVFKSSAHVELMKSLSISRFAVYVTVAISSLYDVTAPGSYAMTQEASDFWKANGAEAFAVKYGHGYISGLRSGAALLAVLEIVADSETKLEQLKTNGSIEGVLGKFSGDVKFDVTSKLKSLKSIDSVRVHATSVGGPAIGTPTTLDELISAASGFTKGLTKDNAYGISAQVGAYEDLYTDPSPSTLPNNKPLTPLSLGKYLVSVLRTVDDAIGAAEDMRDDYYFALANPQLFPQSIESLRTEFGPTVADIEANIGVLLQQRQDYQDSIGEVPSPARVPPPDLSIIKAIDLRLPDLSTGAVAAYNIVFPGNGLLFAVAPAESDPDGFLRLRVFDKNDPLQRWIAVRDLKNPLNPFVTLVNAATRNWMTAPMPGSGAAVSQTSAAEANPPVLLTSFSLRPQSNALFMVSPSYDASLGLSVVGDLFVEGVFVGLAADGAGRNNQFGFPLAEISDAVVPEIKPISDDQ